MPRHRAVVASDHRGREVRRLDWTYAHPERGAHLWGGKQRGDPGEQRYTRYQTVVTAVGANRDRSDGGEVVGQPPQVDEEEVAYWPATGTESEDQLAAARGRIVALLHPLIHRLADKQRPELARESVPQLAQEGHFPPAHSAFDHGVWTLAWRRCLEGAGQPWVSELASARHIQWEGQWPRVASVAERLRQEPPGSLCAVQGRGRHGETQPYGACTTVVRLKRYGRTRLGIVHARDALEDTPRFWLTDAQHGESGRGLDTWRLRWAAEIFHECGKQVTGLEAAQGRKEAAVKRHCRLSGVAQSLVPRAPASGAETERFAFAKGVAPCGQRGRTIARAVLQGLLQVVMQLSAQGQTCEQIFERLMPA